MSKQTYKVTGDTYNLKNKIKQAGGRWDGARKCWIVELYKSDSLWKYQGKLIFSLDDGQKTNKQKEKEFDEMYNEGEEGYNPYR